VAVSKHGNDELKPLWQKKIVGLALGEKSLLAAEVVAGDKLHVNRLAEMIYPEGVTPAQPAELGRALGAFLRQQGFSARLAVVGIPVKWIIVKPKELPLADAATQVNMLRLQAEAEFSTELKDLIYDFADEGESGAARSVLLMATLRKYVEGASALCQAAHVRAAAVMPSTLALGEATGKTLAKHVLVLAVNSGGSELSAQRGGVSSAIRHLRAPVPAAPFVSELRRVVSALPPAPTDREMVLWSDGAVDADALSQELGLRIRRGDWPALGVEQASKGGDGESQKYAPAVALAIAVLDRRKPSIDFLHSRLAAPRQQRMPRWARWTAIAAGAALVAIVWAWLDLNSQQSRLAQLQGQLKKLQPQIADATDFNAKVSFARNWHAGQPRYLAAIRDLTEAMPEDGQTYATSLIIREPARAAAAGANNKTADTRTLVCQLSGKTSDQQHVNVLMDRIQKSPVFSNVKLGGTQESGRSRDVSFTITFTYTPPASAQDDVGEAQRMALAKRS